MNSKVLLIIILIIALIAGIGVAILFLTRQAAPEAPLATPFVSSQPQTQLDSPTLTLVMPDTGLRAGEQASLDVFLDTKGKSIAGLQFIANVSGSALPAVIDADPTTDGVQIDFAQIPELSISTNSVVEQTGSSVVRFAMITQEEASGYTTSRSTQIASIPITPANAGSIQVTFNPQNSRARLGDGGDEVSLTVQDSTFSVTSAAAQTETDPFLSTASGLGGTGAVSAASGSSLLASANTPTPTPASGLAPYCLASCVTDSDCAAGLTCETDRCVNPACATSQTCSCATNPTPRPSVIPTATLSAMLSPTPTLLPLAADLPEDASASTEELPTAGSVEYTYLLIGAGVLLLGSGVVLATQKTQNES